MEFSATLRAFVDKYNPLAMPTDLIGDYLLENCTIYKVVLIVNFIFRTALMTAIMWLLPLPVAMAVGLGMGAASLVYRLTVETNCIYKFSLPAYATSMSLWFAEIAWTHGPLIASLSLIPLIMSVVYIVCDVDFEATNQGKSCCSEK